MNLREVADADLTDTLEGFWGLPVELTDPDGVKYTGEGQVLWDSKSFDPETGEEIRVGVPVVTLRRASWTRVPEAEENWHVRIPLTNSTAAPLEDFQLSATRPPEGGGSLGIIRLYLQKPEQSPP